MIKREHYGFDFYTPTGRWWLTLSHGAAYVILKIGGHKILWVTPLHYWRKQNPHRHDWWQADGRLCRHLWEVIKVLRTTHD